MYQVIFSKFTERYYIKSFKKKYKQAWDTTEIALRKQYSYFDFLFQKEVAETIVDTENIKICKTYFSVAGTGKSPKRSGNRGIIALHKNTKVVHVLLIYHKGNLPKGNETVQWKKFIRKNYKEYSDLLN